MDARIQSDKRKEAEEKNTLEKYRYQCAACEEWFLSPYSWIRGKITCPFCGTEKLPLK